MNFGRGYMLMALLEHPFDVFGLWGVARSPQYGRDEKKDDQPFQGDRTEKVSVFYSRIAFVHVGTSIIAFILELHLFTWNNGYCH